MDESDEFLSVNQKKKRKKFNFQNDFDSINIENKKRKYFKIILFLLVIFNILLYIRSIQLRKKYNINKYIETKNISKTTLLQINNNVLRFFQFKEDIIEENEPKNQIHISMALDEDFIYPTLVSMTSALDNNDKEKNIIIYHLIFSFNFNITKIDIFESLKEQYDVKINYYIFPNIFNKYKSWSSGTKTIYFKIFLPLIFHDLKRIIYLDSDTLIFKDLYEMYNLPFNDNYILGYPFHDVYKIDKFVKNAKIYINGGVLLFNIEKIREDNKDIDLIRFTFQRNKELWFLEQDAINIIFFEKIGLLPLKYGIYMYGDINSFEKSIQIRIRFQLNRNEVINAIDNPAIVHFSGCNPKVWNKMSSNEFKVDKICKRFNNEFYRYANKTKYYSKIYKQYMK